MRLTFKFHFYSHANLKVPKYFIGRKDSRGQETISLSLDRFKDEIECDRIVLRAFLTPHLVATFRASKPDYLHQLLQEAEGNGEGPDGGGLGRKSFSSGTKISAQVGMTSNSFAGSSHLSVSCTLITFFVDVTQNLNLFVVFI